MIEKFAGARGMLWSEFLDLNHTSKSMIPVSLMIPKFARNPRIQHRRTSESGHLDIYGQFMVNAVTPDGGWSKGRPIAFIEERDKSCLAELLLPNDLSERDLERYVADKFSTFAKAGKAIRRLDA